jgi:hypothetical protein
MAKNPKNNIDKAMQALQGALDMDGVGQEIQLPEQVVRGRTSFIG